jgi:YCII-related domain
MATFIFTYRAPEGHVPGSPVDSIGVWNDWFAGMGPALVDYGKPVFDRSAVGTCSSEETQLSGYSIVEAADLESALAIAKGCPFVGHGGGVDVGALADLPVPESA